MTPKIGVSISTHNRRDILHRCLDNYKRRTPSHIPVFVIDDGSTDPFTDAAIRNPTALGVAATKNQGIKLLMESGVDHLFLSDDDTWPTANNWWEPFTKSDEPHLLYLHRNNDPRAKIIHDNGNLYAMNQGTGCLLYMQRCVIELVGGMRAKEMPQWSGEHDEYSRRIHNNGLTRHPYQGLHNTAFYNLDEYHRHQCSLPEETRRPMWHASRKIISRYLHSTDFVPYTEEPVNHDRITICLPWRPTPDRIAPHDRCIGYWREHGFQISESDSDPDQPWHCGQARNNAIAAASTQIIVIADADTLPDNIAQIDTAVELVKTGEYDIVWPYTIFRHIPNSAATGDYFTAAPEREYTHGSPGGLIVARKAKVQQIGGFDTKRMVGGRWGWDDEAFMLCAQTLLKTTRLSGVAWSFNHSVAEYDGGRDMSTANPNRIACELYKQAAGNAAKMKQLIKQ